MFKRPFFAMVGLGAGVALGAWAVRRVDETRARFTPEHLTGSAVQRAEGLRTRMALAVEEGRAAAAAKEAELRAVYRVHHDPQPPQPPSP